MNSLALNPQSTNCVRIVGSIFLDIFTDPFSIDRNMPFIMLSMFMPILSAFVIPLCDTITKASALGIIG